MAGAEEQRRDDRAGRREKKSGQIVRNVRHRARGKLKTGSVQARATCRLNERGSQLTVELVRLTFCLRERQLTAELILLMILFHSLTKAGGTRGRLKRGNVRARATCRLNDRGRQLTVELMRLIF